MRLLLIAVIATFLSSCSNRNKIQITEHNVTDTIDLYQNLVFTFSEDLVPDSITGNWDSTLYFEISPAVKGLYKWENSRQLVFSPAAGFKPSTNYKASPQNFIKKYYNGKKEIDDFEIKFRTPELKIEGLQSWWTADYNQPGMLALNVSINFNYETDPSATLSGLKFYLGNKELKAGTTTTSASKEIVITAGGISREEAQNDKVKITLAKGLRCRDCSEATSVDLQASFSLTPVEQLSVTSTEQGFEQGEGYIRIFMNQPVTNTDISKFISLIPEIDFSTESMEAGLLLRGAFASGSTYQVTIKEGLEGLLGGKMMNSFSASVTFGSQEPAIAFTHNKGIYLSSKGSKNIGIQIVNLPKVRVRIIKIYENNILAFSRNNRYSDWYDEGEEYYYNDYNIEQSGDVVMNQEYETRNLPKQNGIHLLNLNFEDKIPFRGLYLVSVQSSDDQWLSATKLVSVSDIGLMARTSADEVVVFANSILDAKPVSDVQVNVISTNNQVLYSGNTNGDGYVKFSGMAEKYPGFVPGLITAKSGKEFNYMLLNDSRTGLSRFETGGYRSNPGGYMAFLYGDREIYRPGDTIYINSIVRGKKSEAIKDFPIKLRMLLPNGREYAQVRKTLDKQGSAETCFVTAPSNPTGGYTIEMYSGNDVLLASKYIGIEEFMPDRISVKLTLDKVEYKTGDTIRMVTKADNLFGTPASERNTESEMTLTRSYFQPEGFDEYNFSIKGAENISFPATVRQGKTNSQGIYTESYGIDPSYNATGMLQGRMFTTVFDETGRPVNRSTNFKVRTQNVFVGIKSSDDYISTGQPVNFSLVAVDANGKHASAMTRVQIIRVTYTNIMERTYGDRYRYVSQRKENVLSDRQVSFNGAAIAIPFTANESGEYLIRAFTPGSNRYIEHSLYAYRWGYTSSGAFSVNTEGSVDITADKEVYEPGEKAKILFRTPFNGKLLVSIEQNKILEYKYLDTDKKTAELTVDISDIHLPNIYITATLFRPLDDGSIPVTVAHGVIPVRVEKKSTKLPVEIIAAAKSKSKTYQDITVKTLPGKDIYVTLAVVDEGILQLRNTKTPDPHGYFYQKRALETEMFDVYGTLLPDLRLNRSSAAGDGYDLAKRVNPITNKRVKLVSTWSGILRTNSSGEAKYRMQIPQFSGDLRIMAVAYYNEAFGNAEAHMKVADPVVISTALPRFVSPGDTLSIPVTFTNTTASVLEIHPSVETTGGLQAAMMKISPVKLQPQQETRIVWNAIAAPDPGEASFTMNVNSSAGNFSDRTDITIRPPASLQLRSGSGTIKGGSTLNLDMVDTFIPSSAEGKLIVSRSPVTAFADQMAYLLDYPHGCTEQTISTAFPQIYYADLARAILNKPNRVVNVQSNVQAAVSKLQNMQLYNGAITTWPGYNEANWWTTAYATHFLTEASKAGYDVNKKILDKMFDFLEGQVKAKKSHELYYYDSNNKLQKRIVPAKDIFYSLYVLSLNGKHERSIMNYYKSRVAELALDSKYLLAASFRMAGDIRSYEQVLPKDFSGEKSINETGGNYYSYIRDESLSLNALLTVDPDNPQIPLMVRRLSNELKQRNWMSTQERSFAFLALGKFMNKEKNTDISAEVQTSNKTFSMKEKDLTIKTGGNDKNVRITANGSGTLYYFWSAEGLTKDGSYKEEDKSLVVRKSFLDRSGKPLNISSIKQNDLVVVRISLVNSDGNAIENVVVTDMLPAGFEIENPRVSAVPELDWIKDNTTPEYQDIRDDRIHFYTMADRNTRNFYYLVRAVSTGNFVMGPVSADAMYNGEYHSINGGGRVKITSR